MDGNTGWEEGRTSVCCKLLRVGFVNKSVGVISV